MLYLFFQRGVNLDYSVQLMLGSFTLGYLYMHKKIGGDLMEDMQFLASIIFVQLVLDKEVLLKNKVPPLESG